MNEEQARVVMDSICHAADMARREIAQTFSEYGDASAIYRPKIFMDGGKWCALYGDNIQDGVAGFGDSPAKAIKDFNQEWHRDITPIEVKELFPGTLDALHKLGIS